MPTPAAGIARLDQPGNSPACRFGSWLLGSPNFARCGGVTRHLAGPPTPNSWAPSLTMMLLLRILGGERLLCGQPGTLKWRCKYGRHFCPPPSTRPKPSACGTSASSRVMRGAAALQPRNLQLGSLRPTYYRLTSGMSWRGSDGFVCYAVQQAGAQVPWKTPTTPNRLPIFKLVNGPT